MPLSASACNGRNDYGRAWLHLGVAKLVDIRVKVQRIWREEELSVDRKS